MHFSFGFGGSNFLWVTNFRGVVALQRSNSEEHRAAEPVATTHGPLYSVQQPLGLERPRQNRPMYVPYELSRSFCFEEHSSAIFHRLVSVYEQIMGCGGGMEAPLLAQHSN